MKIGGLSYPHKGKGATRPRYGRRRIEKEAAPSTHDQHREAWKTTESCGVMESGSSSTDRSIVTDRVFGLLLGQAHSVVKVRPWGCL